MVAADRRRWNHLVRPIKVAVSRPCVGTNASNIYHNHNYLDVFPQRLHDIHTQVAVWQQELPVTCNRHGPHCGH